MVKPWLSSYEKGVPPTLSYPNHTLNDLLQNTARTYPEEYWNRVAFVSEPTGHLTATFVLQGKGTDYTAKYGWNLIASVGSYISVASFLFFFYVLWVTFTKGAKAADNPWGEGATTLEWTLSSPPPFHQFETLPVIDDKDHH